MVRVSGVQHETDRREFVGQAQTFPVRIGGEAGERDHVDLGGHVVGGEQVGQLVFVPLGAQRLAESTHDPGGVRELGGEPVIGVDGALEYPVTPFLGARPGDRAQHPVGESGSGAGADLFGEGDRFVHGGVGGDPGGQQLVGAEAQHVENGGVDRGHWPVRGEGDHAIVETLHAQGAVGELGREGGIRCAQGGALNAGR